MPTRHADESSERVAQERYMSSPEYVSRRGILANAVCAKAQLYRSAAHRSLLFFLQGLSMLEGGLKAVAEDLFDMFPDRVLSEFTAERFERDFRLDAEQLRELNRRAFTLAHYLDADEQRHAAKLRWFSEFLEDLCIDPAIDIEDLTAKKVFSRRAVLSRPHCIAH